MSATPTPAGLALKVVSVKRVKTGPAAAEEHGDTAWSQNIPKGYTLITVRYSLHNPTSTPVTPVPSPSVDYGPNAVPADEATGWAGQTILHSDHDPQQVGAGQTVTMWRSWMLPTHQIAQAEIGLWTNGGDAPQKVPLG